MTTPRLRARIPAAVAVLVLAGALAGCSGQRPTVGGPGATVPPAAVGATVGAIGGAASAATSSASASTLVSARPGDTSDLPTPEAPGDTTDIVTRAPGDTSDLPITQDTVDIPVYLGVTVGVDDSPTRTEQIPLGAKVTLSVVDPTAADEFHIEGYDLGAGKQIAAGQVETFTFTATTAGSFPIRSIASGKVLLVLTVA